MRKLPWLEIVLLAILALIIIVSVNAIFGADIRGRVDNFCTANELWCAPPTPTSTTTPTPTTTPMPTRTPIPTQTPGPSVTITTTATETLEPVP